MPIDHLFAPKHRDGPAVLASRIHAAVERARSHAIGTGNCSCAASMLPSISFVDFQTALIHHIAASHRELNVRCARSIDELVTRTIEADAMPRESIEKFLIAILDAITSYCEQCQGFRAEAPDGG